MWLGSASDQFSFNFFLKKNISLKHLIWPKNIFKQTYFLNFWWEGPSSAMIVVRMEAFRKIPLFFFGPLPLCSFHWTMHVFGTIPVTTTTSTTIQLGLGLIPALLLHHQPTNTKESCHVNKIAIKTQTHKINKILIKQLVCFPNYPTIVILFQMLWEYGAGEKEKKIWRRWIVMR